VYVEQPAEAYAEPVSTAAEEPVQPLAPPVAEAPAASPLSIAAQRYLDLGDRAFREGRYTDAVQFYIKAVEFAPEQGALYLVLSDALFAVGDYHYAAYAVRRALELDPALVDTDVDKHGFYPDPTQFDEQLATLERYLDANVGDRDARLVLGLNFLFGGRPADTLRVLASPTYGSEPAAARIVDRARELANR
jgi:tetratricopeptide (TPR) repeat protein